MGAFLGRLALQAALRFVQTRAGKATVAALVVAALMAPLGLVLAAGQVINGVVQAGARSAREDARLTQDCYTSNDGGGQDATRWADLTVEQQGNAAVIVAVSRAAVMVPGGATEGQQQRAATVAVATAMQESGLKNLPAGDRDSLGLFQQRPSMGWGTPAQVGAPTYAVSAFLYGAGTNPGLVDVPGWDELPLWEAAQLVQRSGFPRAYGKWGALADDVVSQLWATTAPTAIDPAVDRPELSGTGAVLRPVVMSIPAGDTGCELVTGPLGEIPGWDGITWHKPQPWGGYENGRIPLQALCVIPWDPAEMARCDAVDALVRLNEQWKADHAGMNIPITDSYRDYDSQVRVRAQKGSLAAKPGTSNHGWGLAFDFGGFGSVGYYGDPDYAWMKAHGASWGFAHPPYMDEGGSGPLEPWHWEYMGQPSTPPSV